MHSHAPKIMHTPMAHHIPTGHHHHGHPTLAVHNTPTGHHHHHHWHQTPAEQRHQNHSGHHKDHPQQYPYPIPLSYIPSYPKSFLSGSSSSSTGQPKPKPKPEPEPERFSSSYRPVHPIKTYNTFLPPQFGIYKSCQGGSRISLYYRASTLFTITSSWIKHSPPDLTFTTGPTKFSTNLASVSFKDASTTPHITIEPTKSRTGCTEPLYLNSHLNTPDTFHYFGMNVPSSIIRELFEWRPSTGSKIKALGHSTGWVLVRVLNKETVAVFAKARCSLMKRGEMEFLGSGLELGDRFMLMALMSLLALKEKGKRTGKGKGKAKEGINSGAKSSESGSPAAVLSGEGNLDIATAVGGNVVNSTV